jgi:two-component system alkaline phosphatase synthesis response regulator PhoP
MNEKQKNIILVAEDNVDSRELLKFYLELNDFAVLEAENGEEAIKVAVEKHPDLILMDLNMPVVDGIEAIEEIRRIDELADIPILVNSADGARGMELFLNIDKFGVAPIEYMVKPLSYPVLASVVKSLIQKSRTS